ncbi:MAG TPA: DUF4157 domain-containing protein [Vicinamibacterales bacterium]|nr:DUF4157 domain-containing protein [Vicinamibacterales bacterium]
MREVPKTDKPNRPQVADSVFDPPALEVESTPLIDPAIDAPAAGDGAGGYSIATTSVIPGRSVAPKKRKAETRLQTKLAISEPGDPDEEEADRVADAVLRAKEPRDDVVAGSIARVQRKESINASTAEDSSPAIAAARSTGGRPLDPATRADMEPKFGFDFGRVRVHTDAGAAQGARSINAHAYTVGGDVVFAAGRYAPHTGEGRRLLAHELTHVVQQDGAPPARVSRDAADAGAPAGAPVPAPAAAPAAAPGAAPGAPGGTPAAGAAKPGATPPGTPPLKVATKFDENDPQMLKLRATILDGIRPSVLSENTFVGDVFGIKVELTKDELEPVREKVRAAIRAKGPDIKRRADRAYSDYQAEYDRRKNMGFWDRSMYDLAHTNFFGGSSAPSPNPMYGDPGDKISNSIDNVKAHLDDRVESALKDNRFVGAAQYLEFAERESYRAFYPLYKWREDDIKGAENTVGQLEAIKFASDVALVALGGLGGLSMAKTAGTISMGQAIVTQVALVATKVAVGDKIDWKKEGITGIVNVIVAKFGGQLGKSLGQKLGPAEGLGEAMVNQIIGAMIVHESSVVLTTTVEYVYKTNFESGAKPATWQEFFDILLARMLDPKGAALAVLGAAIHSAVDFKPGAAPKPRVEDPTTKNAVREQTGVVLSKGGPEAAGLAKSVIMEEKNFYGVRLLASERGSWGTAVQGPLEQARQGIIDKIVTDVKAKYPNTTIEKSGGGFINPVVLKFRQKGLPPGAQGTATEPAPVSKTQPAPPPPEGAAPSPQAQSVPVPAAAPGAAPPAGAQGTPQANPQDPALMQAWHDEAVNAFFEGARLAGLPQAPPGPWAHYQSLDASAQLEVQMGLRQDTASGPTAQTQFGLAAAPVMTQKLDPGTYEVVRTLGGEGTTNQGASNKLVLRNKDTKEESLFKPSEGEAPTAHAYQQVPPGTGYLNARAAYGVALGMPSVGKNTPPVTIVEFNGKVGSLQPWKQGTKSVNELIKEDPKLATEILSSPEFKKFKANLDAYDYIINSADRNPGNVLVKFGPNSKVEGFEMIDHDISMTPGARIVDGFKAVGAPAKVSRATYTELLGMKANEASIRAGLELVLNPALTPERRSKADGIFQRLDTMLKGYDDAKAKNGPESIFLD